jgi:hypothetical protein
MFRLDARNFIRDTFCGFTLAALAMVAVIGGSSPAGAVETTVLNFAGDRWLPLLLILGLLSMFLAFNLALYRHVKRVYAQETSRRRGSALQRHP